MASNPDHGLYFGRVMHARVSPFRHRFEYRVFSAFLDIDRIRELAAETSLFSYNGFNLFSFYDRDHGSKDGSALRPWAEQMLRDAGIKAPIDRIKLLCYPRILGYVFNPLSVYYCYGLDQRLIAMIYEVSNTFGEEHCYVGQVSQAPGHEFFHVQETQKVFYVSPFIEVSGQYLFRFDLPESKLRLSVQQRENGKPLLFTNFSGLFRPFSSKALAAAFFRYPLMTLKVIAAIHWEALRLWRKGAKYVPQPAKPEDAFTLAQDTRGEDLSSQTPPLKEVV